MRNRGRPAAQRKNVVRHPAYLSEAKVGVSPFDGGLRLAGTLELTGIDPALRRRRLDALLNAARRYLRDWQDERDRFEWAGLRPVVSDGLPALPLSHRRTWRNT